MSKEDLINVAEKINEIEHLKDLLDKEFLKVIDSFGSTSNPDTFRIEGNLYRGSGISGSVNEEMWNAVKMAQNIFESILQQAANRCINRLEKEVEAFLQARGNK